MRGCSLATPRAYSSTVSAWTVDSWTEGARGFKNATFFGVNACLVDGEGGGTVVVAAAVIKMGMVKI